MTTVTFLRFSDYERDIPLGVVPQPTLALGADWQAWACVAVPHPSGSGCGPEARAGDRGVWTAGTLQGARSPRGSRRRDEPEDWRMGGGGDRRRGSSGDFGASVPDASGHVRVRVPPPARSARGPGSPLPKTPQRWAPRPRSRGPAKPGGVRGEDRVRSQRAHRWADGHRLRGAAPLGVWRKLVRREGFGPAEPAAGAERREDARVRGPQTFKLRARGNHSPTATGGSPANHRPGPASRPTLVQSATLLPPAPARPCPRAPPPLRSSPGPAEAGPPAGCRGER